MKKFKDIKLGIIVFLIMVIAISIIAIYSSYAFVTTTVENNVDYDYTFVMDINNESYLNVVASANSKTIVDLTISNEFNDGIVSYGICYKITGYENSNLLPNIDVYKNVTSVDNSIGSIEKNAIKRISIVIDNRENVDLTLSLDTILGYEFGGELITKTGEHLIYNNLKEELLYINGGTSTLLDKEITDKPGMYATIDNYGDTYYYKGENNNNLIFGKDKDNNDLTWKILRINGDNSIRVMLNSNIGSTKYNEVADNGYMYGDTNKNSSNIKSIIDDWYKKYLINYTNAIMDTLYCNNRTNNVGNGNLLCNKNDSFTIDNKTSGNGFLTYPIGIITYDEVILMGLSSDKNTWTMTSSNSTDMAKVFIYNNNLEEYNVNQDALIVPIISLKENTKVIGTGTIDNPYKVIID